MSRSQDLSRQSLGKRKSDSQGGLESPKKTKTSDKRLLLNEYEDFDEENSVNLSIGRMGPAKLVEYVGFASRQCSAPLSQLELGDLELAIRDTTSFKKPRVLEQLPDFLESLVKTKTELFAKSKENGTPHTLVITGSALRAADIVRTLRKYKNKSGSQIAKLFSKHVKLQESIDLCNSLNMIMGAGTPHRLHELFVDGALSVKELRRIVFDASHLDEKNRGLFNMNAVTSDVMKLLGLQVLKEKFGKEGGIELIFF